MTENEYNLIKTIENKSRYVLGKMAILEEITNPKELMFLHDDIEKLLEKITITQNNKTFKSPDALVTLEEMKMGFIEALVYIDQQLD
jgi:hypothetical protein